MTNTIVSATARSINQYVSGWLARAKAKPITADRMKEVGEAKQYVAYMSHEIITKQGESLLRKMPTCPRASFETFVYLEVRFFNCVGLLLSFCDAE